MFKRIAYKDEKTGYEIFKYTHDSVRNAKLYFTTENFTTDDQYFFFRRSDDLKDGGLYRANVETGECVLAAGPDYTGFCLDRFENYGVICKKEEVFRIDADTLKMEKIGELPKGGNVTGHLTIANSGLIATSYHLASKIYALVTLDPKTGKSETVFMTDQWLGHAQICPTDDNLIFYIHETMGDAFQRTWMFDVEYRQKRPYYVEHPNEWITHEVWAADGSEIVFMKLPGKVLIGDKDGRHFDVVAESTQLLHPCLSRDKKWIAADRINYFGSDVQEGVVLINRETGCVKDLAVTNKCKTGGDHQHPSFNRKGDQILFSAPDENGIAQVCLIDLNQVERP